MKKIIITLAALAAVSGSALAGSFEKSDSEAPIMGRHVIVEQAPLKAPAYVQNGDDLRGGSNNSFSK